MSGARAWWWAAAGILVLVAGTGLLDGVLTSDETNTVPLARRTFDPEWLAHDWYLGRDTVYRLPFNLLAGPPVVLFGLGTGAILVRLGLVCAFAAAVAALARGLGLGPGLAVLATGAYLLQPSLGAGEWMVGLVSAKSLAYALILAGLAALLSRRLRLAALALGLAVTCHVLVGLYAVLTVGAFLLVEPALRRAAWDDRVWLGGIFLLAGGFGLVPVGHNLATAGGAGGDLALASTVYLARHPHHLVPSAFSARLPDPAPAWLGQALWIFHALAATAVLAWWARGRPGPARDLARLGLCSLGFFLVGLGLWLSGWIGPLRYYPFRFPDTVVPLVAWLLVATAVAPLVAARPWRGRLVAAMAVSACVLAVVDLVGDARHHVRSEAADGLAKRSGAARDLALWARRETPATAVFLVDPGDKDFYVAAQRAVFVGLKHVPQHEGQVLEWYRRLCLLNHGRDLLLPGPRLATAALAAAYATLPREALLELARTYGLDFYVGPWRADLDLPVAFRAGDLAVWELGRPD